jgi:hypothetical protein
LCIDTQPDIYILIFSSGNKHQFKQIHTSSTAMPYHLNAAAYYNTQPEYNHHQPIWHSALGS